MILVLILIVLVCIFLKQPRNRGVGRPSAFLRWWIRATLLFFGAGAAATAVIGVVSALGG